MAQKIGVICKGCGEKIPIEDEYVAGLSALQLARSLYQSGSGSISDSVTAAWRRSLDCENPDCGQTHEYTGSDLVLYNK